MTICSYCGGGVPPGKPACPHCGSDAETGWKPEDPSAEVELPDVMDDDAYADFLADEGLAPRAPGRRRDGRPSSWAIFLALLALASLTGLLWILA